MSKSIVLDLPDTMEEAQCMLVFVTAARWGLLDELGKCPLAIGHVVDRYGEAGMLLVDAMCEIGLAKRTIDGNGIALSPLPSYLENHIREFAAYLRHKGHVCKALLEVAPGIKREGQDTQIPRKGEEQDYIRAMHFAALRRGMVLPSTIDWASCRALIDAGCGSGYYGHQLLGQSKSMTATLVDYPEVLTVTSEYTAAAGMQDRARLVACDLLASPPSVTVRHDAALLFSVMHQYGFEENVTILRNLREVLEDGARLLVCDYVSSGTQHSCQAAAFGLLMRAVTPNGQIYTLPEVRNMMGEAGFIVVDSVYSGIDGLTFVTSECAKKGANRP